MKRAFVVLSPECSGSKWATRWLKACGADGDDGHSQPFDLAPPRDQSLAVWRRSLPFGGDPGGRIWPDLDELLAPLNAAGYETRVLVMVRDPRCVALSQVHRLLARDMEEAYRAISRAYRGISRFVAENALDARWVTYEGILRDPASFARLLSEWGLAVATWPEGVDGNAKWK